jgi:hypothetical protein
MLLSSRPASFPIPFGANAGGSFIRAIPVNSQIGVQDGAASLNDGFVPDNFTPLAGGGVPPFGQDINGILKQATGWCQWLEAGSPIVYDSAFAAAVGGYPKGAVVNCSVIAAEWISTSDNNLTNPDDPLTSSGWIRIGVPVGVPMPFLTSTIPGDYWPMNGTTIGNTGSGASLADPSTLFLYNSNWLGFSNTQCPILTSAGAPTTRGANAVADFNAGKRLTMPSGRGLGMFGVDTMGGTGTAFLAGVPITIGNSVSPGSILGENQHQLLLTEIPTNISSSTGSPVIVTSQAAQKTIPVSSNSVSPQPSPSSGGNFVPAESGSASWNGVASLSSTTAVASTSTNTGNGSHNTVERNMLVYWGQKL